MEEEEAEGIQGDKPEEGVSHQDVQREEPGL